MPRKFQNGDFNQLREAVMANKTLGGFVTPGAAVNVNVGAVIAAFSDGTVAESAGATNLAVTAGASAGQSVVNAIVINKSGTVSALAGTSAATADAEAPEVDEATYTLLALVTVANGAAGVTQGVIKNGARNLL